MPYQLEIMAIHQVGNVATSTCKIIVDGQNLITCLYKLVAKMAPKEARATSNQDSFGSQTRSVHIDALEFLILSGRK